MKGPPETIAPAGRAGAAGASRIDSQQTDNYSTATQTSRAPRKWTVDAELRVEVLT